MQFTASTVAFVAALMASQVSGMPTELSARAQMCGAAPAASGAQTPLSKPTAATANACMKLCTAETKCLSFAFGLPPNVKAPVCELFAVAGAKVPAQQTNLVVFDKACSASVVPTVAPTTAHPVGLTATQQQQQQKQGAAQQGTAQQGTTQQGTAKQGQTQAQQGKQQKRNNCGAAPSGPATSAPSPLKTDTSIKSSADCLALCKKTTGCKSVEFGKPTTNGKEECRMFSVPAAQLPAPANGQNFVAFDTGC